MKTENKRNVVRLTESKLKSIIAEEVMNTLNEIGETPQGLAAVAQNVDRRTGQMRQTYRRSNNASGEQKLNSMDKSNQAQMYLAQAIRNAQQAGMSVQDIQNILSQNMGQNYNPNFDGNNINWGYKG